MIILLISYLLDCNIVKILLFSILIIKTNILSDPMKAISLSSIESPHNSSNLQAIKKQGLPNFRNTCYINSNIQFLYSSSQFQDVLRKSAQSIKIDTITYRLYDVFRAMSEGGSLEEKEKMLFRLIRQIWMSNKDLNFNNQQDSFQILLIMLNSMFEEDSRIQQLFEIQLQNSCICDTSRLNSFYLDNSKSTCMQCGNKIHTKILSYSNLLIIKAKKDETVYKEYFKLFDEKLLYKCIGRVFYIGDQQQGHYRASRICNNQFIQFSDLDVFLEFDVSPYFLLYKKIELQLNFQKQSEKSTFNAKMTSQIQNNSQLVVKMIDQDDQLNNSPAILSKVVPDTKIIMNQDTKYAENTHYQAKIFINSPVFNGETIKFCRKIYFNFIVRPQLSSFSIEMAVNNQVRPNYLNPKKKVADLQIRSPKLYISAFIQSYEKNIKDYIDRRVQKFPSEQKFDAFLQKMESMFTQIGQKEIPERLVTITRNI